MLKRVNDSYLSEKIQEMILELIDPIEEGAINFIFVTDVPFLGYTIFNEGLGKYFILINIKVKEMICEEAAVEIVYAMLSHEIGHVLKDLESRETSCIEADGKALVLLGKIYKNPIEVLLKQINYVEKKALESNATKREKEMTISLAKRRRNALK